MSLVHRAEEREKDNITDFKNLSESETEIQNYFKNIN